MKNVQCGGQHASNFAGSEQEYYSLLLLLLEWLDGKVRYRFRLAFQWIKYTINYLNPDSQSILMKLLAVFFLYSWPNWPNTQKRNSKYGIIPIAVSKFNGVWRRDSCQWVERYRQFASGNRRPLQALMRWLWRCSYLGQWAYFWAEQICLVLAHFKPIEVMHTVTAVCITLLITLYAPLTWRRGSMHVRSSREFACNEWYKSCSMSCALAVRDWIGRSFEYIHTLSRVLLRTNCEIFCDVSYCASACTR